MLSKEKPAATTAGFSLFGRHSTSAWVGTKCPRGILQFVDTLKCFRSSYERYVLKLAEIKQIAVA